MFAESVLVEVKKFYGKRRKFNGQINLEDAGILLEMSFDAKKLENLTVHKHLFSENYFPCASRDAIYTDYS